MAYIKKGDQAPQPEVKAQVPSATAFSLTRAEGGFWQFIKWNITADGKAEVAEISQPDLFPIISDKIERFFVAQVM